MSAKLESETIYINKPQSSLDFSNPKVRFALELTLILGLIILALVLRLFGITHLSLWYDESIDVYNANQLSFWETLTYARPYHQHPPLFYTTLNVWVHIVGWSEFAVRFLSVITAFGTLLITYYIARRWLNSRLGLTSLLLLAISPLHIYWSQSIRPYSWFTFLVTVSMLLALLVSEKPAQTLRWVLYGLSAIILLYAHYLSFHVIFAQGVFLFAVLFRNWKDLLRLGIVMLLVAVSFLPWLKNFIEVSNAGQPFYLTNTGPEQLVETFQFFSSRFLSYNYAYIAALIVAPFFAFGLYWLWRKRLKMFFFLLCWSVLPILTAWLSSLIRPNFTPRYFVFCLPAFLIIVAVGIWNIPIRAKVLPYLALLVIMGINGLSYVHYVRSYENQDWRGLVNYVVQNKQEGDIILLGNPDGYIAANFDYYYKYNLDTPGNLERRFVAQQANCKENVAEIFQGRQRVWLVYAEDGNYNFVKQNIYPNLPAEYKQIYFTEYYATEQTPIALALYSR